MPMPWTYRQATREWQAFLGEAKTAMNLESDNATYTAVEGVLKAFRRRLTPQQAVDFAQVLPSVVRALFVADWTLDEGPLPPGTRAVALERIDLGSLPVSAASPEAMGRELAHALMRRLGP